MGAALLLRACIPPTGLPGPDASQDSRPAKATNGKKAKVRYLKGTYLTRTGNCEDSVIAFDSESDDVLSNVDKRIKDQKVIMFAKSYCPFCKKVKQLFDQNGVSYSVIELDQHQDGAKIQGHLMKLTNISTVPVVFIKGKLIGGSDNVMTKWNKGSLQKLLGS